MTYTPLPAHEDELSRDATKEQACERVADHTELIHSCTVLLLLYASFPALLLRVSRPSGGTRVRPTLQFRTPGPTRIIELATHRVSRGYWCNLARGSSGALDLLWHAYRVKATATVRR